MVYEKETRLSFHVRSCGHFCLVPPARETFRKSVDFCEIFWGIRGSMKFRSGSREFLMKPDYVWYYPAGSDHDYVPCGEGCEYRFITIAGRDSARLFSGLDIPQGLSYAGPCPQELFSIADLNVAKINQTKTTQMQALAAAFQILTMLSPGQHMENIRGSMAERAKTLIDSGFADRELNVEKTASLLGVHRGSLSRAFANAYKISVSHYISRCRVRNAMKLLKETELPILNIALQSGFNSHEYFTRVFMNWTGFTPALFRRQEININISGNEN